MGGRRRHRRHGPHHGETHDRNSGPAGDRRKHPRRRRQVGSAHVSAPNRDGYTFVFGWRSDAIDITLYKHPIYSLKDDLTPVVLVADQPTVLVVREDLAVNNLKDFVDYVKKNASTVKMGSAGIGATGTVDCALLNDMIGVNIQPIPIAAADRRWRT